ncbi:hypothetical protein PENSPDRAFT_594339, partial [Peniophora sp. CONT]
YRCVSGCMRCDWYCRPCLLEKHADLPLHRIETWVDGQWNKVTLRALGLAVHLGHPDGSACSQPQRTVGNFVVIHTNGVHEVKAVFCGCSHTFVPARTQLVRERWWPATTDKPQTAATFEALDTLDALGTCGKTNAYEFWNAACILTDATGTQRLPDRSKEVARMVHVWRHILMCKRAGRGHDRFGGIDDTASGDLAVMCPACPHEELNTDIVEKVAKLSSELVNFNRVLASMDCNFRQKNKMNQSTNETSPYLGDGMAFMVPQASYEEFTSSSGHQDELSSCSRFGAMVMANMKQGKGLRTTGIGAVFCARHGLFWPNTVGTLVKGERYCTMDFILAALVRRLRVPRLHLSYDIICQYSRNLERRMTDVSEESWIHVGAQKLLYDIKTTFAVPKFHSPGHKAQCQQWFNLGLQLYTGQTDGEASERGWAGLNPAASSMKEMGPGTMRDTVDFYCNAWNWRKIANMGPFLERKLELALIEAVDHSLIYSGPRRAIANESAETLDEWTDSGVRWETRDENEEAGDEAMKNPYKPLTKPISLQKARLECAKLMAEAIDRLGNTASNQWIMPHVYAGMKELEGEEEEDVGVQSEDDEEEAEDDDELDERDTMEEADDAAANADALDIGNKAGRGLYLPSELPKDLALEQSRELVYEELRMRWNGMGDNVILVRQYSRIKGKVNDFKKAWIRGQHPSTRAREKQNAIEANLATVKESYRLHCARFARLVSFLTEEEQAERVPSDWKMRFRELEDSSSGEGGHKVPWIWYTVIEGGELELNDDMRVEFLKCQARAMRWTEEVYALCYEMIRVPTFLRNKSEWWAKKAGLNMKGLERMDKDGARGYAKKQATMYRRQAEALERRFSSHL